jgi:hypothetical protein
LGRTIYGAKRYFTCPAWKPASTAASHSGQLQLVRITIPKGKLYLSNLDNALQELRAKRRHAQIEIEKLDQIISGIESLRGTQAEVPSDIRAAATGKTAQSKRIISMASRRKMALAQKARWANARKQSQPLRMVAKSTESVPAKRKISAASRRKMAAAARAHWAAFRAAKKKAA